VLLVPSLPVDKFVDALAVHGEFWPQVTRAIAGMEIAHVPVHPGARELLEIQYGGMRAVMVSQGPVDGEWWPTNGAANCHGVGAFPCSVS
jgi:hypothetical protein